MDLVISPRQRRARTEDQMSDEKNDETTGRSSAWESEAGHDAAVPEDPAQAIALPAVTPPLSAGPAAAGPQQPDTPPAGMPQQGSTPPLGLPQQSGTYAMGALGGSPMMA